MVNRPVGPPGGPPVPTVGAWFRGSFAFLKVCADTAAHSTNMTSAVNSALVASLIAFLLPKYKVCLIALTSASNHLLSGGFHLRNMARKGLQALKRLALTCQNPNAGPGAKIMPTILYLPAEIKTFSRLSANFVYVFS